MRGRDGRADHTGRVCGLWQQAALGSAWEIAAMRGGARMERDGRSGTPSKSEKAKVGTGITGMGKGLSGKSSSGNRPKWEWPNAGMNVGRTWTAVAVGMCDGLLKCVMLDLGTLPFVRRACACESVRVLFVCAFARAGASQHSSKATEQTPSWPSRHSPRVGRPAFSTKPKEYSQHP
jgi:hypothetical protein